MSTSNLITLLGILVASVTTFLVAYWHRKQLRQIEEFRRDPSAGLQPPPSRTSAFLKKYRELLVGIGIPTLSLSYFLFRTEPITRWIILLIAVNVAAIPFAVIIHVLDPMLEMQVMHLEVTKHSIGLTQPSREQPN